jgi:acid ceramidase
MALVMNVVLLISLMTVAVCFAGLPPPFEEVCVHGTYPPQGRPKVPTYVINLDLPPLQRWDQLGKERAQQIAHLLTTFKQLLLAVTDLSQYLIDFVDGHVGGLVDTFPMPYKDELKGLAKASGLNLGEVVLYNIFYEVFTVCTSIVAQSPNGTLYHARNLDFGLFMGWDPQNHTWHVTEALRPAIVNLDWQKSGKTLFKSVNYAGYIGILTAIKRDVFTLSMNERFNLADGGYIGILKWLLGDRTGNWMSFLTRHTMEDAASYKQAKDWLSNTPMLAPAYFILGGRQAGEASIITRSRASAVDVWDIGTRNSTWYILETNYDNWEAPLFLDDRRTPAHRCMKEMGQKNVSFAGIFDVLSSKPVLNKLTTYTALMQVNSGAIETYLQYCPDPCFPW